MFKDNEGLMQSIIQILFLVLFTCTAHANELPPQEFDIQQTLLTQAQEIQSLRNRIESLEQNYNLSKSTQAQEIKNQNAESDNSDQQESRTISTDNLQNQETQKIQLSVEADKAAYDLALASLKEKDFTIAEEQFVEFIKNFPDSPLQSNAYFWYAESFYQRGLFDKAALIYLDGYKKFPQSVKAPDYLLKAAYALSSLSKNRDACTLLKKIEKEFPEQDFHYKKKVINAKAQFMCNKIYE